MNRLAARALRALLPAAAINRIREMRNAPAFALTPRQAVDASRLPLLSAEQLDHMLGGQRGSGWEEDHAAIAAELGGEDRLGGVNPGDRRAIYQLVAARQPERVLEVGTHIGASTLYFASALARLGHGDVTTVDILDVNADDGAWRSAGLRARPSELADSLECRDRIDFVVSPALQYMRTTARRFDFVFIDGDHSPAAVYREVAAATRLLERGGVLLLHDYYPGACPLFPDGNVVAGPYRALERILNENAAVDVLPLGDLPWPTKQGSHATSLALVVRANRED